MISVTNPAAPMRHGRSAVLVHADYAQPADPARQRRPSQSPSAIELTVCQQTPTAVAIAEMVVQSINRRSTSRAHRRVVLARGAASLPRS